MFNLDSGTLKTSALELVESAGAVLNQGLYPHGLQTTQRMVPFLGFPVKQPQQTKKRTPSIQDIPTRPSRVLHSGLPWRTVN